MDNSLEEVGVQIARASARAVNEFRANLTLKHNRTAEEISALEQIFLSGLNTGAVVLTQEVNNNVEED